MSDAPKRKVNPMLVLRGGRPGAPLPPTPAPPGEGASGDTVQKGGASGGTPAGASTPTVPSGGGGSSNGLPSALPGLRRTPPRTLPTIPGAAPSVPSAPAPTATGDKEVDEPKRGQDTVGDKLGLPARLPVVVDKGEAGDVIEAPVKRPGLPATPAAKRVNPLFADMDAAPKREPKRVSGLPMTPPTPTPSRGQDTVGDNSPSEPVAGDEVGEATDVSSVEQDEANPEPVVDEPVVVVVDAPKRRPAGLGGGLPITPPKPVAVPAKDVADEEEGFTVNPDTGEVEDDEPELSPAEKARALLEANLLEDDSFVDTQSVENKAEESWGTHSGPMPGERKKPARAVNPLFADVDAGSSSEGKSSRATPGGVAGARKTAGVNPLLRPGLKRAPTPSSLKPEAFVEGGDWDDEPEATSQGPLAEGTAVKKAKPRKARRIKITERDQALVKFLARYKYATNPQLARLADVTEGTISGRMARLEDAGLVTKETITGYQYVWLATKAGHAVADVSFPMLSKSTLSFVTMGHSLGMVNLGVEFERQGGGVDLLGERKGDPNAPAPMNRWYAGIPFHDKGRVVGEQTVTEREIQQAQKRFRGGADTATMRELVHAAAQPVADDWEAAELQEGGEGLFIVYGDGGKTGEHIPDLVLARPRGEDGRPRHVAVELELNAKNPADWRRILRAYRDYGEMFEKVVYFTHKPSIARGLQRVADSEAGLKDKLVIRKYKPMNSRTPFWG